MAKNNAKEEKAGKAGAKAQGKSVSKGKAQKSSGVVGKVNQFKEFFEESKVEIKKVTWPSRKETTATSIAVLVLVFVMAAFLGLVDLGLAKLVGYILS